MASGSGPDAGKTVPTGCEASPASLYSERDKKINLPDSIAGEHH